ncbi:MAG: hypothetical protein ONB05_11000 [candidate division KSB1 bacterium]|nr:hypothetical protein [candidate division KSB1 bacterium]
MEEETILQQLEQLVQTLAIELRYEKGDFEGGLCRVNNHRVFIINATLPIHKKIKLLAGELGSLDLNQVFIRPALRKIIEEGGNSSLI